MKKRYIIILVIMIVCILGIIKFTYGRFMYESSVTGSVEVLPVSQPLATLILKNAKEFGGVVAERTKLETNSNETSERKVLKLVTDDYGSGYYFSGNVQDNFINFAGKCWRIVRIQGDNSVKIVLDDDTQECQKATGMTSSTYEGEIAGSIGQENASIGEAIYGFKNDENNVPRLDYKNNESGKLSNEIGAKEMIDSWIDKMSEEDKLKLKEEDWCVGNQNKWYYIRSGGWTVSAYEGYSETLRKIYNNEKIDLRCESSDKVKDLGGLLTAEEVIKAGYSSNNIKEDTSNGSGSNSYLWVKYPGLSYVGLYNWRLATPAYRNSDYDYAFIVVGGDLKYLGTSFTASNAIRPAVVLKSSVKVMGDGTSTNPYVVVSD